MPETPAAGNPASGIPEEAVTAAAVFLHDNECNDGDTQTCGRWRCGIDPANQFHSLHARHVEYYRDRAVSVLGAAWPGFVTAAEERTAGMAEALNNAAAIIEDRDRKLAHERERTEALIVQAQDYACAESERADKLAALALKAMNQCHALDRGDASYLDAWSMALDQLEGAAGEMSPPDSDPLEDAYQTGIKAERDRVIRLASAMRASFPADHPEGAQASFADYLRVTSADSEEQP